MDARDNRFLEDFSAGGRERLMAHVVYRDFAKGDYLFHEGDPGDGVCLIISGEVEIGKTAGGREQLLTVLQAGDFLGEVAVLDGQGRSTDALAREDTSIAFIPKDVLLEVLLGEPASLTMHLFQQVLSRLRRTNELFVQEVVHKEKLSLIGEMATTLMHDIRNPVQIILSAADMIRMHHSDKRTVDCCEKVRLQCNRLVTMAGELLEFSRGESKLHLVRTDTRALLKEFQNLNQEYFRQSGLQIEMSAEPAEIEIDSTRVLRVLQNLATNAVDAIKGEYGGRIDVRAWVRDSILYLSVKDNGPGVPEAIRDRIFEPFVTQGKEGGTGLGMAIVRNVITAHRGTVTFETSARGTTFIARIPQDSASDAVG